MIFVSPYQNPDFSPREDSLNQMFTLLVYK